MSAPPGRHIIDTEGGPLTAAADPGRVWRIGYAPEPWRWTPWQYTGSNGIFNGRWDDPRGSFRTVYAGSTLLACLLEVLAPFRTDPYITDELDAIDDDDDFPSGRPGLVPRSWLSRRRASVATLIGVYCVVTDRESLATIRTVLLPAALRLGLADIDGGALRLSAPRELTQQVAAWLYDLHDGDRTVFDGVAFESRHGDGLPLWAVFERDDDLDTSRHLADIHTDMLDGSHPDVVEAFRLHRLAWSS